MEYQYKLIVSNKKIYKEFIVASGMQEIVLGTTPECGFRLNQDYFFSTVKIFISCHNNKWKAICNDGVYFYKGDSSKLLVTELKHGDVISLKYTDSDKDLFDIHFMIDFDYRIPFYNWYINLNFIEKIIIGDRDICNIKIQNQFEKNILVEIVNRNGEFIVIEHDTLFGIYVNGVRLAEQYELKNYDFITISGTTFYFKENNLYFDINDIKVEDHKVNVLQENNSFLYPKFVRNTRRKSQINNKKINILDPSQKPSKPETNIMTSLLPALVMFVLVVVMRGIMSNTGGTYVLFSICSMALGLITTIIGLVQNQKKYKKEIQERKEKYELYIEKKCKEIEAARTEEVELLKSVFISQNEGISKLIRFDSDIFDRTPSDDDFLYVYLGIGKKKACREIEYKHQEKLEEDDELALLPEQIAKKYEYVLDVPIVVDLHTSSAVGVVGTKEERYNIFKNMIADIVVRQYHSDVDFYILLDENIEESNWLKYLPQVNDEQFNRNLAFDVTSRTNVFENLYKEFTFRSENPGNNTHILVFSVVSEGIISHPISKFIENANALNATFIFFEEGLDYLPLYCSTIIECREPNKGIVYKAENKMNYQSFKYEIVPNKIMHEIAKKMAAIYCEEISLESSLCKNISLFEILGIYMASDLDLEKRWNASRIYETMAVPLGVNSKDEIVYLNLHEKFHGPHGLVAGTTGSGKSEILQSYILSAATLFHPYEIGFVIIDFKGGGMVNQFSKLPHLIGAITNIDGKEIDRSLKSIKAELVKRQELFALANVNHIDKYIKAYKDGKVQVALPHLVIIVDEFAELKAEQPEFMKELISVARIGRSLGIHLILATQKPAGQVNEQIWSNSKFKLCLKVQNQEDSKEVLKSPLAAEIKEPGRAYLQVGNNEIFELFQSAYSGGPAIREDENARKSFEIYKIGLKGREKIIFKTKKIETKVDFKTELEAIVNYISEYCGIQNIQKLQSICMPSLSDLIHYEKTSIQDDMMSSVAIGIYDAPERQYQGIYRSYIGKENTLIIGGSQTGKTNFIQLCIREFATMYTPEDVVFYILDFGSRVLKNFEGLKHIGGIVLASEDEKIKNLFKLLALEIENRKEKLMSAGVSSFAAYREAGFDDLHKIYFFVDNFNAFKELYIEKYEQDFVRICRDGISLGISVLITNVSTTGIGYRHLSNFSNRVCFSCNDITDYNSMLDKCRMEPKGVPGRLLFQKDKEIYEAQSYLAFAGEKEIDRAKAVREFVLEINERYIEFQSAKQIPEIPNVLKWEHFEKLYLRELDKGVFPLGLDFATIEPLVINMLEDAEISIISKKKSNAIKLINQLLKIIGHCSFYEKYNVFIIDSIERAFSEYKDHTMVQKYSLDVSEVELMLDVMLEEVDRNKNRIIEKGINVDISYNVLFLNSKEVIEYISTTKPVLDKFKELVENYKNYGVLIVYSALDNVNVPYNAPELLKRVKENKKALIIEQLSSVKIFDIPSGIVRSFDKKLLSDEAYYLIGSDMNKIKIIT